MNLEQWVLFEERLRQVKQIDAFHLLLVNGLHSVMHYAEAILFERNQIGHYRTRALSNISEINEQSGVVQWVNHSLAPELDKLSQAPHLFELSTLNLPEQTHYLNNPYGLYLPLHSPVIGHWALVFWFKQLPAANLIDIAPIITSAITNTWERLKLLQQKKALRKQRLSSLNKKKMLIGSLIGIGLLLLLPVRENTIAPAEVVPLDPIVITPSINGTIKSLAVKPNELVQSDQLLVTLDDIVLRNQMEEAQQDYKLAHEKYLKAYRHAYGDQGDNSLQEMSILAEEQEQAKVKFNYQQQLLNRSHIHSPRSGVALFSDPNELLGKPIKVGEKIMLIADPKMQEIAFWIAMDNIISLDLQHAIQFYSNENPAQVTYATIKYINPIAEVRPDNTLAYYGVASLPQNLGQHLGEQGVVKLFGNKVSLFYYLIRRPLRFIRQHVGY